MTMFWVALGILTAFGTLCFFLSRQLLGRLRSIASGIAVQGRCIRRYSSDGSEGNTYWHHAHGFTTLDGQYVEFEEDAVLLAQGDTVTVRYRPSNPAHHESRRNLVAPLRKPLRHPHLRHLRAVWRAVRVPDFRPVGAPGSSPASCCAMVLCPQRGRRGQARRPPAWRSLGDLLPHARIGCHEGGHGIGRRGAPGRNAHGPYVDLLWGLLACRDQPDRTDSGVDPGRSQRGPGSICQPHAPIGDEHVLRIEVGVTQRITGKEAEHVRLGDVGPPPVLGPWEVEMGHR
ncbi:DUF3592 domain-containing protein [Streptomyces lasiicapitis]|uniref:DUF3592 domain-containing protein n=1 Tax=Streptomyces lasiicapitis TaxID=1923961 RepID=UPI003665826D